MTKIRNNPLLHGASGKLGNTVVYKQWQGQVIMTNKPAKRKVISEKQLAGSDRFRKATNYAKKVMAIPAEKAEYTKGITPEKNCASRVAVTDYLTTPIVHYIKPKGYSGTVGDIITIKATDDFKVTEVIVQILNSGGELLEKGNAIQNPRKRHMWKYTTTLANENVHGTIINVIACDKPGNRGMAELLLNS
jgi:hypothetical protein